jgi:branched-chain amino acid transport system substrate-binding protein
MRRKFLKIKPKETFTMQTSTPFKMAVLAAACLASSAYADINIGVSFPLTGAASSMGIPLSNQVKLWPQQMGGEKLNVVVLDDATDPAKGAQNAQKFITSNVDLVVGSVVTPISAAMAQSLNEAQIPQFSLGPFVTAPGKDPWSFRLVHGYDIMAKGILDHMKKSNVKTLGFLGYSDAYGEGWLTELNKQLASAGGPQLVDVERFARTDQSVSAQALKLTQANPDAILVVASGGGAALPHRALIERGYKGHIYQTHAAAGKDLIRLGGKDVDGAFVIAAPSVVAEQLPASNASKPSALEYVQSYETAYGAGTRASFSASAYDVQKILQIVIPKALKTAKPGTQAFRTALRDAVEQLGSVPVSNGVLNFSKDNHWAYGPTSPVMLRVVNGEWKVE